MDLSTMVGVVGIIVGVIVAYHLALGQGVFSRPKLRVILGSIQREPRELKRYKKKPWALLYGLPKRNANYYAFCLPIILLNKGKAPLKDIWVQISYPRGRDSSSCKTLAPNNYEIPGRIERTAQNAGGRALVEFHIKSIRPKDSLGLMDLVLYTNSEFSYRKESKDLDENSIRNVPHNFVIDQVRIYVRSENHKAIQLKFWLVAAISENIDELEKIASIVGEELYKLDKPLFMIKGKPGSWFWLPPPHKLWTRRINLCQLGVHFMKEDIAIDNPYEGGGIFQTADVLPVFVE